MATDDKIELVEGRVVMASPVSELHGSFQLLLSLILARYRGATPGISAASDASIIIDGSNEVRPDAYLRILAEFGGQTNSLASGYVEGAPEWMGEIAYSSVSVDLHDKKSVYERNGVHEYFVYEIEAAALHLFQFNVSGNVTPDSQGILKSIAMPGLWIDCAAFIAGDVSLLLQTLERGLASREHKEFIARLTAGRGPVG